MEVTSSLTCAAPKPEVRSTIVTVNPLPSVTANANGSSTDISICHGSTLTLTGSGTATSYIWNNGVTNGFIFTPAVGTYSYTVTGTDINGCRSTDNISVTVVAAPKITLVNKNRDKQEMCGTSPTQNITDIVYNIINSEDVEVDGLPAGVSYNFSGNVLTISGKPTVTTLFTYNYTVTATNPTCDDPGAIATGTIKVYDGRPLIPDEISGISVICPTTTTTFSVPHDPNTQRYYWTLPTGFNPIGPITLNTITVQIDNTFDPSQTNQDYIRVRSRNSCGYSAWRYKTLYKEILSIELNAGADASICFDDTLALSGSVIDEDIIDENSITFEWSDGGAGGTFDEPYNRVSIYTPPTVTVLTPITLVLKAIFPPGLCNGEVSDQLILKVYPMPTAVVTSAPVICQGDDILITGTPNTIVFYRVVRPDGTEIFSSINLNSSGNAIYPDVPAGEYFGVGIKYRLSADPDCLVPLGGYVFMNAAPTVNAGSDISICSNVTGAVTLTPTFGGTNPSVAWSTAGDGSFTGNSYLPGPNDIFFGGTTLTLTNTPTDGICSPNSDSMQLVIKDPVAIDTQPFAVNACTGENVTFSVGAAGDDLSYQWYYLNNSNPVGTNSNTLNISNITPANAGNYYVIISGNSACSNLTSATALLTVNNLTLTSNPNNLTVCEGSTATLSATATGDGLTYQWYHNGNPVSGATSNTLNIANSRAVDAGNYYVVVSSNYCSEISSTSALLTVTTQPMANISYSDSAYCTDQPIQFVTLAGVNNSGGNYSSTAGLSINSASGAITPALSSAGTYNITYTVTAAGGCSSIITTTTVTINEVNGPASAGVAHSTANCTITNYTLAASSITASGAFGLWTVTSGQTSGFFFSDPVSPTSSFIGESGEIYTLRWTITNAGDCGSSFDDVIVTFPNCEDKIFFDGINDYVSFNDNYTLGSTFSIEVWVKRNNTNNIQTIFSKRNGNSTASGYDLSIINNRATFRWNANSISSTQIIDGSRWYHLAVTNNNNNYSLYVDGKLQNTVTGTSAPAINSSNTLLGAMTVNNERPINHFAGDLDELRIWNKALTINQIRLMMNQEIEDDTGVIGSITKAPVPTGLLWSDLDGYYQMNQTNNDILNGELIANNTTGIIGKLINMDDNQDESAPLPYISSGNDSVWDSQNTWLNGAVQMLPNTNDVNWNIVQTEHDISTNRATTVLGLIVNKNKLSVINEQPLEVTKYLNLNTGATLKLVGESQLLQPEGSIVDYGPTSFGILERDQQGTGNRFNYNYWGSPVSTTGPAGTRTYRLDEILYDGGLIDQKVRWIAGYDGNSGPPVNIARRWLYTYNATTNQYLNTWNRITETSMIKSGLGFLMKGAYEVGAGEKNYTFKGQPNNGTITNRVDQGNSILIGNPYPSAIDAKAFIIDNGPSIQNGNATVLKDGALSFWEHYTANNTHVLRDYVGGYATYNLIGGQVAATPPPTIDGYEIANGGTGTRKPTQYIPVGQGFFVTASETGGEIIFRNSQRIFRKEAGGQSIFFRAPEDSSNEAQKRDGNPEYEDDIQRVRLTFKTPEGAIRPLLLGFTQDNAATDGIDYGYDAYNNDAFPSDLSFAIEGKKFVIQGVGVFDINKKYPLDMTLKVKGPIEIALSKLENFDAPIDVYVHDALLDTYTQINDVSFQLQLKKGNYTDRFYIVFQPNATLSTIDQDFKDIHVKYLQKTDEIYVKTPASIEVRQVYLINMAGQAVKSWNMTNMNFGQEFKIPVRDISEGNYILKVETSTNSYNKKMIVKFK